MGRYGGPKKSRVEFTPPKDLELDGDAGESLVKWKKLPSGKVCILSMDGVSLGGDGEKKTTAGPSESGDSEMGY